MINELTIIGVTSDIGMLEGATGLASETGILEGAMTLTGLTSDASVLEGTMTDNELTIIVDIIGSGRQGEQGLRGEQGLQGERGDIPKWKLLVEYTLAEHMSFIQLPIDDTELTELYVEMRVKPITDTISKNSVRCGINATAWHQVSTKPLFMASNCLHATWEAVITSHIFKIGTSWRNGYSQLNGSGTLTGNSSPQMNYTSGHLASDTPKINNICFDNNNGTQLPMGSTIYIYGR